LLLDSNFDLKIADFGLASSLVNTNGTYELTSVQGTDFYMAPEIRKRSYNGDTIDIFACGVILFMMYSQNAPFKIANDTDRMYSYIMNN